MSDQVIRSTARPFPARAALPWLAGAAIYGLLLALGPKLLNDPDSFSHIGGRALDRGARHACRRADPFSFSMHGAHWIAFEWLSELSYAGAYWLAGWPGVVVLAAAAIALAFRAAHALPAARAAADAGIAADAGGAGAGWRRICWRARMC